MLDINCADICFFERVKIAPLLNESPRDLLIVAVIFRRCFRYNQLRVRSPALFYLGPLTLFFSRNACGLPLGFLPLRPRLLRPLGSLLGVPLLLFRTLPRIIIRPLLLSLCDTSVPSLLGRQSSQNGAKQAAGRR
jgi:hypothetical protein